LKYGSELDTGAWTLAQSSSRKKYPRKGAGCLPNRPSRYAIQMSSAFPIASSVRLLKLLPKLGPTWDLNSTATRS